MRVHSFSSILRLTLQIFDAITRRSSATSLGTCRYVVFRIVTGFTDSPIDFLQQSRQHSGLSALWDSPTGEIETLRITTVSGCVCLFSHNSEPSLLAKRSTDRRRIY